MDIRLFVHRLPALSPNLLAEVEERMHQHRRNTGEAQTIGYRKRGRQEEWAVRMVLVKVDRRVGVEDLSDIV